jgi:uncharacterized protein (DUF433 family)
MQEDSIELIGKGIYTVNEAAALIGLPGSRVRRWIAGYKDSNNKLHSPLAASELPKLENKLAISFADLVELCFIKAFLDKGVSLIAIRKATALAAEIIGVSSHPFATHHFKTDTKSILHSVDEKMLNLNSSQYELEGIIKQSLFDGFTYDNEQAVTWRPSKNEKTILLDPRYSLGKPINERLGIRTKAIFNLWQAENKNTKTVASLFQLKPKEVMDAVHFEQRLAA